MMMSRKRTTGLTEHHKKILRLVDHYMIEYGYPPSVRDLKNEGKFSSTSVVDYYLKQLTTQKIIERAEHTSRSIRLLKSLEELGITPTPSPRRAAQALRNAASDLLQVPVFGRIFASQPVPVPGSDFNYMDAESMVSVAQSMLPPRERGEGLYALEVRGDSMIDAMVNDGDIVIMKPTNVANNGEMVAVWLTDNDETTLKYFFNEGSRVRLQPANPQMGPIYKDPSVIQVQGKVIMIIRSVETRAQ